MKNLRKLFILVFLATISSGVYGQKVIYAAGAGAKGTTVQVSSFLTIIYSKRSFSMINPAMIYLSQNVKNGQKSSNPIEVKTVNGLSDVDGNYYKTVKIGNQSWMAENLRTTKYNDGTPILKVIPNSAWESITSGAYCWYNNDEDAHREPYGALYNWYAVSSGKVCPEGWYVPSNEEWNALEAFLGGNNVAGNKLKERGTSHWPAPNTGATNSSGFTALPCGYRSWAGEFRFFDRYCYWWSSTESNENKASAWYLFMNNPDFSEISFDKPNGFYIRCIKGTERKSPSFDNPLLIPDDHQPSDNNKNDEDDVVYILVEEMPSFRGGDEAFRSYVDRSVNYPVIAQENGIEGTVFVFFVVDTDGSITNVKVAKGVDPALDKEALRVISSMPPWIPGRQNGISVKVSRTVPIGFKLQ